MKQLEILDYLINNKSRNRVSNNVATGSIGLGHLKA